MAGRGNDDVTVRENIAAAESGDDMACADHDALERDIVIERVDEDASFDLLDSRSFYKLRAVGMYFAIVFANPATNAEERLQYPAVLRMVVTFFTEKDDRHHAVF